MDLVFGLRRSLSRRGPGAEYIIAWGDVGGGQPYSGVAYKLDLRNQAKNKNTNYLRDDGLGRRCSVHIYIYIYISAYMVPTHYAKKLLGLTEQQE